MPNVSTRPRATSREARHARIVGVEHGDRLRSREPFDQFALGQRDFVHGCEKFQMHRRDARDHAHFGLGNLRQAPQFAAVRHAQFDHRGFVLGFQPQQRERQPVFVVQVALGFQDAELRAQQRRQNFLRGGLSDRSGDRRDAPPPGASHRPRQFLQRRERVRNGEELAANRSADSRPDGSLATTAATAPGVQSGRDKIVSIVTRSVYGDEQLASSHGARINRDTGQPGQGVEPRGTAHPEREPLLQPSTA